MEEQIQTAAQAEVEIALAHMHTAHSMRHLYHLTLLVSSTSSSPALSQAQFTDSKSCL